LLSLLLSLAASAESRTLLVIGDTGDCDAPGTAQVSAALRRQPDWQTAWLIELGDLAYPTATLERLLECHEPYFRAFEHRLAVPGNHDWHDAGGRGFFGLFPEPVPRAEMLDDRWTLWLLNSNLRAEAWEAQLRWLDAEVKSTPDRCVIAAWHHPRWSSGHRAGSRFTDPLWQRVAGRATLTLHGHDHHYESLPLLDGKGEGAADGTRSFIVGNGGAELYRPGDSAFPGSKAVFGRWGFLRIELAGDAYRWRAFDVSGEVIDSGAGRCQPVAAPARQ
jgi:hypothetical protein